MTPEQGFDPGPDDENGAPWDAKRQDKQDELNELRRKKRNMPLNHIIGHRPRYDLTE